MSVKPIADDATLPTKGTATARKRNDQAQKLNGRAANRLVKSSAEFVAGFVPPDYLIEGYSSAVLYALTGKTGAGKLAIELFFAAHVGLVRPIGDRSVERGKVLFLTGENPDDVRMRWIAMSQQMDFDINSIEVYFIPGTFKISEMKERIRAEVDALGGVALIIVDTGPAFFEVTMRTTTPGRRPRPPARNLTELPGGPCVLAACHPPKTRPTTTCSRAAAAPSLRRSTATSRRPSATTARVEVHGKANFACRTSRRRPSC